MPPRIPEPAELAEDLSEIKQGLRDLSDKLDRYVPREVYDLQIAALAEHIGEVKDSNKWIGRTAVSALIFPIVAGVIVAVLIAGGVR